MIKLDGTDLKLLEVLRVNSKLSTSKLSKKTQIPITTVFNRIKKLEKEGLIKSYTLILDQKKLGNPLKVYVFVHYDITVIDKIISREQLKKQLLLLPKVEEISYTTGRFDIFLKVQVKDMDELNELILGRLRKIPGVGQTESFFVLEEVK